MYTAIVAASDLWPPDMAVETSRRNQELASAGGASVPMEQVRRDQALNKSEFHQRLRAWLEKAEDAVVGAEGVDGRTGWVYVRDGSTVFVLHADTKRDAVVRYLQLVKLHGDDLQWEITETQRGNLAAVVYGPEKIRHKPFYLYLAGDAG